VAEEASAAGGESDAQPLLRKAGGSGRELILVITSNRGLAGAYNANVLRKVTAHMREQTGKTFDIEVVGKKGVGFFKFSGKDVRKFHSKLSETPSYEEIEVIADDYMANFTNGTYDAVHVAYMAFETVSRQKPTLAALLPLDAPASEEGESAEGGYSAQYEFSPNPRDLLDELLPATVKARLLQAFNEAILGEHIARMVAMKAATDAAGKMGKSLKRDFNRARQAAITTELSEIIAGAAALN
jgi:F-type H+-transporting ATPase subunit gamma